MSPVPASDVFLTPVRLLAGLAAATLPRRLWNEWEGRIPVAAMALPAALLAVFLGFGLGIPSFLRYAQRLGTATGDMVIAASEQVNTGSAPSTAPAYAWFSIMLALPAFAFFTPMGLASTYLVVSGTARALCWSADDPIGDPLLTGLDAVVRRSRAESLRRRTTAARNAREGAPVPDALVTGRALGVPEAEYVVIASRQKPGWDKGVFVLTAGRRFKLGEPLDRRFPDGLRALYPLVEAPAAEATRRAVSYVLPALSEIDPVTKRLIAS